MGEHPEAHQSTSFRSWPDVNAPPYRSARQTNWSHERADLAEGVFQMVTRMRPNFSLHTTQKITGMLMQLDLPALESMVHNDDLMNARVDDAVQALIAQRPDLAYSNEFTTTALNLPIEVTHASIIKAPITSSGKEEEKPEEKLNDDDEPLFYEPGKPGFFALRAGRSCPARLSAFRNVGR